MCHTIFSNNKYSVLIYILFFQSFLTITLTADHLRVCSQNLYNYGNLKIAQKRGKDLAKLAKQKKLLASRFLQANCDLIAVQEIVAKDQQDAELQLGKLSTELQRQSSKKFLYASGKSNDPNLKLGFLFLKSKVNLIESHSYANQSLPKVSNYERRRYFSRGPFRINVSYNGRTLTLFNFHFKSRATFGRYDPSGYGFELDRIQMSQKLNDIAREYAQKNPGHVIILLGDRNSIIHSSSAKVLRGILDINFFKDQHCKLAEDGRAFCKQYLNSYQEIFRSIVNNELDLESQLSLSRFKLIDDILVYKPGLKYFRPEKFKAENDFDVGYLPVDKRASDHPLLWADVNF